MNHLYLTFIAICFLYRCVYVSVIHFSQWNSLWLFEFTGASVLSILYTTYNVPIIKGIHHRFHGILGVVMVTGEKEVSTLPCQATCWILFSFDLFFSLDYFIFLLNSLLFHSNNTKYSSRTYCTRYCAKHFKFIVSFNPKKVLFFYSRSKSWFCLLLCSKQHSNFSLSNSPCTIPYGSGGTVSQGPHPSSLPRCGHMTQACPECHQHGKWLGWSHSNIRVLTRMSVSSAIQTCRVSILYKALIPQLSLWFCKRTKII